MRGGVLTAPDGTLNAFGETRERNFQVVGKKGDNVRLRREKGLKKHASRRKTL